MGDGGQQEHFLLDRFQELGGTESFFFFLFLFEIK